MKVLVAGGAGYIGTHTCVALAENGFEIVCADNFSNSKPLALDRTRKVSGQDFEFVKADFCDPAQSDAVFEGRNIDAVIYFAAFKAVGESVEKPLKYYGNNLIGLMNILNSVSMRRMRRFRHGHATSSVYAVRFRREAERSQDSTQCLQVMFLSEPACLHQQHLKAHLHLLSTNSSILVSISSNLHVSVRAQSTTM